MKNKIIKLTEFKELVKKIIKEEKLLNEAKSVSYKLLSNSKYQYQYIFNIDGIKMECNIFHDENKNNIYEYEVSFGEIGKGDFHRIGKDLKFSNTVLETVSECIKDFLNREPDVNVLKIEGAASDMDDVKYGWEETIRKKYYLRFIKNKFSEFTVKEYGRFIKVYLNKKIKNQLEEIKKIIKHISDKEEIPDFGLKGKYISNESWSISTDYGINSKHGQFYIDIENDYGDFILNIEIFDEDIEINKNFKSFENLKNFIISYFN